MKGSENMEGVIVLDDKYGIKAIDIDYALVKFFLRKGIRDYKAVAYYSSVAKCLKEYVNLSIHDELDVKADISLSEAAKRIDDAITRSNNVIKATFPEYKVIADE